MTCLQPAIEGMPGGASPAQILSDFLSQLGDIDASTLMMYMDGLTQRDSQMLPCDASASCIHAASVGGLSCDRPCCSISYSLPAGQRLRRSRRCCCPR